MHCATQQNTVFKCDSELASQTELAPFDAHGTGSEHAGLAWCTAGPALTESVHLDHLQSQPHNARQFGITASQHLVTREVTETGLPVSGF